MSSFKEHFLDKDKRSKGVKLPLLDRDGNISDDYVMVRWGETDEVRAAMDSLKREMAQRLTPVTPDMTPKQKKQAMADNAKLTDGMVLNCRCVQVAGWSFSEKPTKANVLSFLKERPDIADRIDRASANTKLFFMESGESS